MQHNLSHVQYPFPSLQDCCYFSLSELTVPSVRDTTNSSCLTTIKKNNKKTQTKASKKKFKKIISIQKSHEE